MMNYENDTTIESRIKLALAVNFSPSDICLRRYRLTDFYHPYGESTLYIETVYRKKPRTLYLVSKEGTSRTSRSR
jgi:hypothetical protein